MTGTLDALLKVRKGDGQAGDFVYLTEDAFRALAGSSARKSSRSVLTAVPDGDADTLVLAANPDRVGARIFNSASTVLFVACDTTVSPSHFTDKIPQAQSWDVPFGYTGQVHGMWEMDTNDGSAFVTEFTA